LGGGQPQCGRRVLIAAAPKVDGRFERLGLVGLDRVAAQAGGGRIDSQGLTVAFSWL
jgi:hypothetical protein